MTKKKKEDESSGLSLDDAFADDDDVVYAKAKPKKIKESAGRVSRENSVSPSSGGWAGKKNKNYLGELGGNEKEERIEQGEVSIKSSKPISKIKKGDKIKVDSLNLEVDSHYILIDHGSTKEMAVELFDPKTDKDYQLRYFSDQVEATMEFYQLEEIIYNKISIKKVEW